MAFEVSFELKESDLEHFRNVMRKAQEGATQFCQQEIITNAKTLIENISQDVPAFVSGRVKKLAKLVAMIEDEEWQIPEEARADVFSALAYFSDPEDLVPDHIPVLGYIDDAIMIELVCEELKEDIDAYSEFCQYRDRKESHNSEAHVTKGDWLDAKRKELHSRMRNRRSARRSERRSFSSIF